MFRLCVVSVANAVIEMHSIALSIFVLSGMGRVVGDIFFMMSNMKDLQVFSVTWTSDSAILLDARGINTESSTFQVIIHCNDSEVESESNNGTMIGFEIHIVVDLTVTSAKL